MTYLIFEIYQPLRDAAIHTTDWSGATYALTLIGELLTDSYVGRFQTVLIFSAIYAAVYFFFSFLHLVSFTILEFRFLYAKAREEFLAKNFK